MGSTVLHRRERLIITAIQIIDELGIKGLSTREIAKREGVSEATLFRHFKNKNELLLAVLDNFTQFDSDLFQSAQLKSLNPKESIRYILHSYMEYYESYPAMTAIMQSFDALKYEDELSEKVQAIIKHRSALLKHLVDDAQRLGEIRAGVEGGALVDAMWGLCMFICLRWRIEGQTFSIKEKTLSALELILDAFAV